jgi:hypothetical protein
MKRTLCLVLLFVACRQSPSPESQAVTTAASETTATVSTETMTETLGTAPAEPTTTAPSRSSVNGPKLLPVDVATSDPSLAAFRDELLAAVRKRDANAVVALSDPKIRTSFGGGGGAAGLRKALQQPGVWEDFEQLLQQGGQFVGEGETRSFWAPYVYSAWPDSHDVFQFLAVTGEDIPLHEAADASSHVMAMLSHDIVERKEKKGDWQQVKTADGHTGWVEARNVRSPVGYRAGFLKMNGKWKMNALVAGD